MNNIDFSNIIFGQLEYVLDKLSGKHYTQPLEILSEATIGQHMRHILDFYLCVLNSENNVINYDKRIRDSQIEEHIDYTQGIIENLRNRIGELDLSQEVAIQSAIDKYQMKNFSSIGRELIYGFDHAVHHLALIKIGIRSSFPEIKIEDHIGVAPSTLKYREEQCAR